MTDKLEPIFPANYSVTGIRSENSENTQVLITGSYSQPNSPPQGMLYSGPMNSIGTLGCYYPVPNIPGVTGITSSILYGPDTPLFTPSIDEGSVRVVGSYQCGKNYNHGLFYEGPLDGSGTNWQTIDMLSDLLPNGELVANTILHSTMGKLIVGNYDLQDDPGQFNAFVYNINTGVPQPLTLTLESGDDANLVTAYGIWQHGIDSTDYTIVGGLHEHVGAPNVGYLVDYNSETSQPSNLRTFRYDKEPDLITHFEGITQNGPKYYSLAATGDQDKENRGAAFAVVERLPDGSFGPAKWERVYEHNGNTTTGNTVLTNNLFGIYVTSNSTNQGIQSYVARNLSPQM